MWSGVYSGTVSPSSDTTGIGKREPTVPHIVASRSAGARRASLSSSIVLAPSFSSPPEDPKGGLLKINQSERRAVIRAEALNG